MKQLILAYAIICLAVAVSFQGWNDNPDYDREYQAIARVIRVAAWPLIIITALNYTSKVEISDE